MLTARNIAIVVFGLVLCACLTFAGEAPEITEGTLVTREDGIVVGDFEYNGKKVHFESYDPKIPSISEPHRALNRKLIGSLKPILVGVSTDTIIAKKYTLRVAPHYAGKLISALNSVLKQASKLRATDKTCQMDPMYEKDVLKMLQKTLKDSETVEPPKLGPHEFVAAVDELVNIFETIIEKSSVGLYNDFNKLTIDGERIDSISATYIAYFRKAGYGGVLKLLDIAIGLLSNFIKK